MMILLASGPELSPMNSSRFWRHCRQKPGVRHKAHLWRGRQKGPATVRQMQNFWVIEISEGDVYVK